MLKRTSALCVGRVCCVFYVFGISKQYFNVFHYLSTKWMPLLYHPCYSLSCMEDVNAYTYMISKECPYFPNKWEWVQSSMCSGVPNDPASNNLEAIARGMGPPTSITTRRRIFYSKSRLQSMNKYVASQNDLHSAYISMFLGTCTLPKHCLSSSDL